jgi:predicted ATP-dependent serine protease
MATKGELIQEFLTQNSFTDKKKAYQTFLKKSKVEVSMARFYNIWNKMLNEGILDDVSTIENDVVESDMNENDEEIKVIRIDKIWYPDSILTPFKSNTILDILYSEQGGILPATITMAPGESGVGKSTLILDYLGKIKQQNPKSKIGFISSEMNDIHLFKYSKRISFKGIDIMLLGEYRNPYKALEKFLETGYDIIFLDSFQDTVDKICADGFVRSKQAESMLLSLMDKVRKGNNQEKKYTAFICSEHLTKSGEYAGSTRRKHMTDAMLKFSFDENGDPNVEFVKNRDGAVKRKLYYKITKTNGVLYNSERFTRDEEVRKETREIKEQNEKQNMLFDQFFLTPQSNANINQ